MPNCMICGVTKIDLTRHIKYDHKMSVTEYNGVLIDPSVGEKRRATCLRLYGDSGYKNKEAQRLSNEIYEGGHSLRDPSVREKARETKQRLYNDPKFTNRSKAEDTCLKRYGVSNPSRIESVKKRSVQTLMKRYGRIFNYDREPTFSKDELINLHVRERKSLGEIGRMHGLTANGVSYWMKKYGIPVTKRISA